MLVDKRGMGPADQRSFLMVSVMASYCENNLSCAHVGPRVVQSMITIRKRIFGLKVGP